MNPKEVAVVLKILTAAKPGFRLDERTPDVWANVCATVDPDVGLEAARRMVASLSAQDRFPAPADFMGWVRAVSRSREPLALPEDTGAPLSREENVAKVAEARRVLRAARFGDTVAKVCMDVEEANRETT